MSTPVSDSRVGKLADFWKDPHCEARHFIHEFERAGLIVLDPDDPEVIDRVARAINSMVDQYSERWQARERARARAVLSALKADE